MPEELVPQTEAGELAGRALMIIDDQESTRVLMRAAAEGLPFPCRVLEAVDGQAAIKLAREEQPDLVLLDIVLPGSSTSGVLICNTLCREGVKVVIVSGQASKAIVQACLSSGAIDYVPKPFSIESLREKIQRWMEVPVEARVS